jgi:hypothetical protein
MVTISQLTFEQIHQRFGMPDDNFPDLLEFFSDAMTVPCVRRMAHQACRESRAVALKRYSTASEGQIAKPIYLD